KFWLNRLTLW
ncbi:hypothetical protein D039_1436B, partial [Vibrio parahaemolyticus EKP-028]